MKSIFSIRHVILGCKISLIQTESSVWHLKRNKLFIFTIKFYTIIYLNFKDDIQIFSLFYMGTLKLIEVGKEIRFISSKGKIT